MKNIKIVYFDAAAINPAQMGIELNNICNNMFSISPGLIMVNYHGTAKELFELLQPFSGVSNLMVLDVSVEDSGYWGYMNANLWRWIESNTN